MRTLEKGADAALEAQPNCLFISFIYERELDGANTDDLVAADLDLTALADHVFAVLEGGFLLVRALDDRSAIRRQIAHLRHYLELLLT